MTDKSEKGKDFSPFKVLKEAINNRNTTSINNDVYKGIINSLKGSAFSSENCPPLVKDVFFNCQTRDMKFIIYALQNGYLDPNEFMVWIISLIKKEDPNNDYTKRTIFKLLAFCLRYGADPNIYYNQAGKGRQHIIINIIERLQDIGIMFQRDSNTIIQSFGKQLVLLFALFGSNVLLKAKYDEVTMSTKERNVDKKLVQEASKTVKSGAENATVKEVLDGTGFNEPYENPNALFETILTTIVNSKDRKNFELFYGYLLDDTQYTIYQNSKCETQTDINMVLEYNAIRTLQKMPFEYEYQGGEVIQLIQAIECISLEAFVNHLRRGVNLGYFTLNRLILKIMTYGTTKEKYNRVYSEVYSAMLKEAIALGASMDNYQYNFIKNFSFMDSENKDFASDIAKIYTKPLWEKVCIGSYSSELPERVNLYAISLGVPEFQDSGYTISDKNDFKVDKRPGKKDICLSLTELMSKSEQTVKSEYEDRLRKTVAITIPGRVSSSDIECANIDTYYGDPLSYNENTVAYYKDTDGKLYCFTAPAFEDLKEDPVNPITKNKLPIEIQIKIQKSLALFDSLNINPEKIIPVSEAYKKLKENDIIDNKDTEFIKETVNVIFYSRGISKDYYLRLTPESYNKILDKVGMQQDYLDSLKYNRDFLYATFANAFYTGLKTGDKKLPDILTEIIQLLNGLKSSGK